MLTARSKTDGGERRWGGGGGAGVAFRRGIYYRSSGVRVRMSPTTPGKEKPATMTTTDDVGEEDDGNDHNY